MNELAIAAVPVALALAWRLGRDAGYREGYAAGWEAARDRYDLVRRFERFGRALASAVGRFARALRPAGPVA